MDNPIWILRQRLTLAFGIVGSGVDEKLWIGQRVGVRLVLTVMITSTLLKRTYEELDGCIVPVSNVRYVPSITLHVQIRETLARYAVLSCILAGKLPKPDHLTSYNSTAECPRHLPA